MKVCADCKREFKSRVDARYTSSLCRACACSRKMSAQEGSRNPAWKGGHRFWRSGKHGRDKDGLSWKVQRRLAWKRDQYACQATGCDKKGSVEGWRPDCHHVIPYRVSKSHALENLLCLCKSHHKREEAKYKENTECEPDMGAGAGCNPV